MPEAQSRLTVSPGTEVGSPASSAAMRATLRLSSPAWLAHPKTTSSRRSGSMFEFRFINSSIVNAAKSSARMGERAPRYLPMGVRMASII